MSRRISSSQGISIAVLAAAALGPPTLSAQDSDEAKLEEIIVTAQKRSENLQDVPVSVQVINSQALVAQNLNTLQDLTQVVPGVHVTVNGANNDMFIRGIGSGANQSFDQSVGSFIDDIYHGRSRSTSASFLDLDHIEVLKGPQSTFFGNNAIAGALNIVTRRPGDQPDASARLLYGRYGQYAAEGAIGGPVTDTLRVRLSGTVNGESGWLDNVYLGEHAPRVTNKAARLTLLFKPTDALDATLKVEGSKDVTRGELYSVQRNNNCPPSPPLTIDFLSGQSSYCAQALALNLPIGIEKNQFAAGPGQGLSLSSLETALTINYRQWGHTFTSVTGFYNYHFDQSYDFDQTPLNLLSVQSPERYHQISQEFRVASAADQAVEYLAGAYVQRDTLNWGFPISFFFVSPIVEAIPPFAPLVPYLPLGTNTLYAQDEKTEAIFGSLTWHITDRLKLTGGLRGSWVQKSYNLNYFTGTATRDYGGIVPLPAAVAPLAALLPFGPNIVSSGSRSDRAALPSAKVQYDIAPRVMAYLSYAKGFKAGGFNGLDSTGDPANVPYKPEHVNAYEIGLKSEVFDQRILLNLAVFRSDYQDLQVATFEQLVQGGPNINVVRNAGTSRSRGVDVEGKWVINPLFRLALDGEYLDSYYVRYNNGPPTTLQLFAGQQTQNLSGAPTDYSPKWSASIHASFTPALPGGYKLTSELIPYLSSRYYVGGGVGADPFSEVHPYVRLDARVSLESPDGHWGIDLIGQNLTDRNIPEHFPAIDIESKQPPRSGAVQVRYQR